MEDAVGAEYIEQAAQHLDFLKNVGLEPEHSLLDYGCGVMRLALHAIPYLSNGRYVGVDISVGRLAKGQRLLAEHGISEDRYQVFLVNDCSLKELAGLQFDMIWANSVITHMPVGDIKTMLTAMGPLFKSGGRFFFSFTPNEKPVRKGIKDFYHPPDFLQKICEDQGYHFELRSDWGVKRSGDMVACVHPARTENA